MVLSFAPSISCGARASLVAFRIIKGRGMESDGTELISAVIVTYDSAECVGRCIASIRQALPDAEVVVVDNASRDETIRAVQDAAHDVQLVQNSANIGFGRACNIGARAARGSHLLFVNPDVVVTEVDRLKLGRVLASRPLGLVAPALEGEGDRRRAESWWSREYLFLTFATLRPHQLPARRRIFRGNRPAWVSGAMLFALRDEFLGIGGFDARFFLYYEDRDLSHRYRDARMPIRTIDAIRGRHIGGTSSASDGLRTEPMAWSLLGWIEYLFIHEGEHTARRAARATLATLRCLRYATRLLATLPWPRAERKARQLDELFRLLARDASIDQADFCVDALRIIRGSA